MTYFSKGPTDFEERIIDINRVTKATGGGQRLSFTALAIVGDRNGRVGVGYGKARNTNEAISKAKIKAKNNMVTITLKGNTIPHEVIAKYGASIVLLKPAPVGSGIIAGGPVRSVVELAGIKDISAKILGSNNKITTSRCVLKALGKMRV